ncbi:MAG: FG-GAP repeat protein [Planctomycetes bacterium]|nr:FG-GAP repeat protein [Planctomycetota bacterium]
MSHDGDVAVVGDVEAFGMLGAAYVFRRGPGGPGDWHQEAVLMAPDPDPVDIFGGPVAVSGDVIVLGAPGAAVPEFLTGAAYIYRYDRTSAEWAYETTLTASDGDLNDIFGFSVSIDGDVLLVGARDDENDGLPQSGSAYVFRYNGADWVEEAKLTDPDGEQGDLFGVFVSIRGDVALIGAHGNDDPGLASGAAFVFRYDGAGWNLESELNASDAEGGDRFGLSVSLGHNRAIVGAYWENSTPKGNDAGSAYIFRYDGVGWFQEQKITASDADPLDWFGASVSISEDADTTLIGAPRDEDLGFESGSAYVFRYTKGRWDEATKLLASDGGPGDGFGGNTVSEDIALIKGGGKAYVFAGIQGLDCNDNGEPDACDIFDETSEDQNGNGIPDECELPGDLNGDGVVGILDLLILLAAWGPCNEPCPPACAGDLNGNCTVNVLDLLILLANWT